MMVMARHTGGSCYICGKSVSKSYIINFGYSAITFKLCRACANKLAKRLTQVLEKKEERKNEKGAFFRPRG